MSEPMSAGDAILWEGRPSLWHLGWRFAFAAMWAGVGIGAIGSGARPLGRIFVLIAILIILRAIFTRLRAPRYSISRERILVRQGILAVNETAVRLADVRGVNMRMGVVDRLLGTGTIEITSAAWQGRGDLTMWNIPDAVAVRDLIERAQTESRG